MIESVVEVRDRLETLFRQESRNYRCPNYLDPTRNAAGNLPADSLVSMLEECANLVADIPMEEDNMTKSKSYASFTDVQQQSQAEALASSSGNNNPESLVFWRQQMFDWACTVVDSFEADREIVAVSFNILDRFVVCESQRQHSPEITRDDFQLFCMTCLYIAVKILEPYPRKLGVAALVDMSRGYYAGDDICATEQDILMSLKWFVNPPTAIRFCRLYGEVLPKGVMKQVEIACCTMTEIAVAESAFLSYSTSIIGLVSLLLALRMDRQDAHATKLLDFAKDLVDVTSTEFCDAYDLMEKTYGA